MVAIKVGSRLFTIGTCAGTLLGNLIVVLLSSAFPTADAQAGESLELFPDWRLRGRFVVDGAQYSGSPLFANDVQVRRARLAVSAKWTTGSSIKLEQELRQGTFKPMSLYFRQKLGDNSRITVGHFKVPLSLQLATSSLNNTFMERALPNVGTNGYRLGTMFSTYGEFWSVSTGITGGRLTDGYDIRNDGVGFFTRGVLNPTSSKNRMWHFGVSSEFRRYGSGDSVRLRSRPESAVTDERLVDTRRITDLNQSFQYTAEFAWKRNSLHAQVEYMGFNATRQNGSDLNFNGWYAQAGWFVSGESRRYDRRYARFRKTKPRHSFGAWEVALRYSDIDLNSADVLGGAESNIGIALNWYTTESLRFSLNYIEASARRNTPGLNNDVSIVQARFQFSF